MSGSQKGKAKHLAIGSWILLCLPNISPASQLKTTDTGKGNIPGTQQAQTAHTAPVAAIQKGNSPTAAPKLLPPFFV